MHLKIIAITFVIDLLPIKMGSKIPDFFSTLEMLVFQPLLVVIYIYIYIHLQKRRFTQLQSFTELLPGHNS